MGNNATTLNFAYHGKANDDVAIARRCCIVDEQGVHHRAIKAKGIKFEEKIKLDKRGTARFSIYFDPLPKGTKVFDFMESLGGWNAVQMMKIHEAGIQPSLKTWRPSHIKGITHDDFKEDTVWVTGALKDTKKIETLYRMAP